MRKERLRIDVDHPSESIQLLEYDVAAAEKKGREEMQTQQAKWKMKKREMGRTRVK